MNTVSFAKIKVQSINDVVLYSGASNKLRGDAIILGAVRVSYDANDEILEKKSQGKDYIIMN